MASKAAVREDGADLRVEVDLRVAFRLSKYSVGASHDEQGCPGQAAGAGKPFGAGHRYGIDVGRRTRSCKREKPIHGNLFFAGGHCGGGMNRGLKRSDSVPAFYSEWYPASVLLFPKEGTPRLKTMKLTAKLPIRTADFPTEPNRVRLRKHDRSAIGLTASF